MSWADVHDGIVATMLALTPTSSGIGSPRYRHSARMDDDTLLLDRSFFVSLSEPPLFFGEIASGAQRWISTSVIRISYDETADTHDDDRRIAEDAAQIQVALLAISAYGSSALGVVPSGDSLFAVSREYADGYSDLLIEVRVHHT